jgi:hypothetical protein
MHRHRPGTGTESHPVEPEVLSLYGALHLVLAVAAAEDNKHGEAHQHLETARKIAEWLRSGSAPF